MPGAWSELIHTKQLKRDLRPDSRAISRGFHRGISLVSKSGVNEFHLRLAARERNFALIDPKKTCRAMRDLR